MDDLWKLTAVEIATQLRSRALSAREVTTAALARLADVNPKLNAVVEHRPEESLLRADHIDREIAAGRDPGPMAGVPVTIKVNVDQAGYATTNGLVGQKDLIARSNSPVVDNLLHAGAVPIGRTNTPAFSMRWFTDNQLHGATLNPHDPRLTPGGSSGGAGAAVAAGIGPVGQGTDIGGSIRYPAYACGIHGLRPTMGRAPHFNASGAERAIGGQLMSVSGPLARSMGDLRLALAALSRRDIRDPWWVPAPLEGETYPRSALLCLRPAGIATSPEIEATLRDAAARMTDAGWRVREVDDLPAMRDIVQMQADLWFGGDGIDAVRTAVAREGDPGAIAALRHVFPNSDTAMPLKDFAQVLARRATLLREWLALLEETPVVLLPMSAQTAFPRDHDLGGAAQARAVLEAQLPQLAAPVLGLPALSVATGFSGTAPLGVQLIASRYREDILLAAGSDIVGGSHVAMPPVTPA